MPTRATALAQAAARLAAAGVDEARLDATLLLADLLHCSRTELLLHRDQPLPAETLRRYDALVARRARREPLPYLLGWQEFMGLRLKCDPRALIPRWDTEPLVEQALALLPPDRPVRVADLCTGSGAVAVALAVLRPLAAVWATDLSPAALSLAAENATLHGVAERVHLGQGDLAQPLLAAGLAGQLDLVAANPPYIATAVLATLEPEVRVFEPRLALDGGADGLDVLRALGHQAAALLRPAGVLLCECGSDQALAAQAVLTARTGLAAEAVYQDYGGRERGVRVRKS